MEKQMWEEKEKRREEKRREEKRRKEKRREEKRREERSSEKIKSQKKDDVGARKGRRWFVAPEGRTVGWLKRRVRSHLGR